MVDRIQQSPDLPLSALAQDELHPRRVPRRALDLHRHGPTDGAIDGDATPKLLDLIPREASANQCAVLLLHPVARVHHRIRKVAVVREQDEPLRVFIKPSDRIEPHVARHE